MGSGITIEVIGDVVTPGANLDFEGQSILVDPSVNVDTTGSTDGTITFKATDTQTGGTDANASVAINGATISGGDLAFQATAKSDQTGSSSAHDHITGNATATVAVIGASSITSSGNASLSSQSTVNAATPTTGSSASTSVDGAVAQTDVDSEATTHVSDHSTFRVHGDLIATATNTSVVTTSGDATAAANGAGIALTNVKSKTRTYIDSI